MSDSSSLSSAPSTDDEAMMEMMTTTAKPSGINRYFKPVSKKGNDDSNANANANSSSPPQPPPPPPPPRRSPSPPHEYVFADNDAIAFLVMFRSRFHDAFPKSLLHFGPQDIERGVAGEAAPDEHVERLLCVLLGLVLNRKKDVERAHYGRALEEAIASNQNQWPKAWKGTNPLHGGNSFNTMTPEERLVLLKTLVLWALNSSDVVQALIKESYKQTRRDDDKNQPRSVQPWFQDSFRRRYWLIEGLEDSHFRIYRENDGRTTKTNTWFSVAGTIDEVNALADKFKAEATTNAKINSDKLRSAIPRFEAGDVKRQRREYRLARKAAFSRPEPGFSLYEGRTRGKRMKYTFSDGEEDTDHSTRRSTRNATPLEALPTITASGRQVKSRLGRLYGDSPLSDDQPTIEQQSAGADPATDAEQGKSIPSLTAAGRPMRGAARSKQHADPSSASSRQRLGQESDSDEHHSEGEEWSGNEDESDKDSEPDFDQEDGLDDDDDDDDEEMSDQDLDEDELQDEGGTQESLVVQLRYRKGKTPVREVAGPVTNGAGKQLVSENGPGLVQVVKPAIPAPAPAPVPAQPVAEEPPSQPQPQPIANGIQSHGSGELSTGSGAANLGQHQPQHQPPVPVQAMDVS